MDSRRKEVMGKNFFELAPSEHTQELRNQVQRFILGSAAAHSFNLTLQLDEELIDLRVLLARTRANTKSGAAKAILIHIRRARALVDEAGR